MLFRSLPGILCAIERLIGALEERDRIVLRLQLFARLQGAISGRPIGQAGRLHISAGVAELKPEDDSISFFERADQALYRAKDAGKGRAFTADGHAA